MTDFTISVPNALIDTATELPHCEQAAQQLVAEAHAVEDAVKRLSHGYRLKRIAKWKLEERRIHVAHQLAAVLEAMLKFRDALNAEEPRSAEYFQYDADWPRLHPMRDYLLRHKHPCP